MAYGSRNPTEVTLAARPLVSVIVVNYNGGEFLRECLESVRLQSYADVELIVVDNASQDGSADWAEHSYEGPLKLIRNPTNEGFAGGNNRGFEVARGDWVLLLNNDAVVEPEAIGNLVRFGEEHPEAGMLACRVVQYDHPNILDSAGLLLYPDGVCRSRGWLEKDVGQYDQPQEVLCPAGCAALYRKAMLDETGTFDEAYFMYLEDLDLGVRGQLLGWSCFYVPDARFRHRKSQTTGDHSKFKAYHVERNRIYNVIRLMPRFIVFVSPLFTLNRYLMQGYAVATRQGLSNDFVREYSYWGLAGVLLRAYSRALFRLPALLRQRRQISEARKITTREWYDLISRFKLDAIELALKV
jgi:GT2 family glycosyltransferase